MTWDRVLVGTDLSEESARAGDACIGLPGRPCLVLALVTDGADRAGGLEAEATRLRGLGADVTARVVDRGGRTVANALVEAARDEGANLLVIGARGRGRAVDRLLGSVSEAVLRGGRSDVLVVRGRTNGPLLSRVLVPTDLSATSVDAARRLVAGGGIGGGVLLHVGSDVPEGLAPLAEELGLVPLHRPGEVVPVVIETAIDERATLIALCRVGGRDAAAGVGLGPVAEGVALTAPCPVLVACPRAALAVQVRELLSAEFPLADEAWRDYHETRGDPGIDRVFGVFVDRNLVALARCRRHPDGYEVDAVFTPAPFRGRGYANRAVGALVEACQNEDLFMHAVHGLEDFYGRFGFVSIPESRLPPTIRSRYAWATGDMASAGVTPMYRPRGWFARAGRDGQG